MWGELVIENKFEIAEEFEAHYIFQAGDDVGGTIHMNCKQSSVMYFGV